MSEVSYEKFLPEVLPYVPDCAEFAAVNAIRNACIEFCKESLYLQQEHDPITLIPNVGTYELDAPDGYTIARAVDGWVVNMNLQAKSEDDLKRIYQLDWRIQSGRPQFMTQFVPTEVVIVPKPQVKITNGMKIIIAVQPTRDSTTVDDKIYERWAEGISFGARARLYDTPKQPYYDPQNAVKYRQMFNNAIGEAKIERNRGMNRTNLRVRPPRLV